MRKRAAEVLLAVLVIALWMTGCAQIREMTLADDETVLQRSQARMDLLISKEFEKAYQYMSPGYRARKSLNQFRLENAGVTTWVEAVSRSAECIEDRCKVFTDLTYQTRAGTGLRPSELGRQQRRTLTRTFEERWVRIDGTWWFYDTQ